MGLLKSPFVVHPKTGRVGVPIEVDTVDTFDPFTVPSINQLMQELDEYAEKNPDEDETSGARRVKNYQKTSLVGPIATFNKFLVRCGDEARGEREQLKESQDAEMVETGNW